MIPVIKKNIINNSMLSKLYRGDFSVLVTSVHLAVAITLASVIYAFAHLANSVHGFTVVTGFFVIYGIYIANIGIAFWRLARKFSSEMKAFLLRVIAVICIIAGITGVLNGLNLVLMLILFLKNN